MAAIESDDLKIVNQKGTYAITPSESEALHFVRALAFILIFILHLVQTFIPSFAGLLAFALQLFFILSGFIFGKANVCNWGKWLKKRFLRIYCPYLIILLAVVAIYSIGGYTSGLSPKLVIGNLFLAEIFTGYIPGLSQFWFVSVIFICYLITPALQRLRRYKPYMLYCFIAIFIFFHIYYHLVPIFISLYGIAYFIASADKRDKIVIFSLSVATIVFLLMFGNVSLSDFEDHTAPASLIKCSIGIIILYTSITVFSKLQLQANKIIKVLSKYSYEAYLFHPILIFGPLSLRGITENFALFSVIILVLTYICTFVLYYLSKGLENYISKIISRLSSSAH